MAPAVAIRPALVASFAIIIWIQRGGTIFPPRPDDIVISTYGKSGTSWLQQIVAQLLFNGAPILGFPEMSPWLESRLIDKAALFADLDAQAHRRFIKSHLPFDALPWSPTARYIYSARDVRDLVWSLHRFHSNFRPLYLQLLNNFRGEMGRDFEPADPDIARYYRTWLEQDGQPFWPFWSHVKSWWEARHHPNVLLVHFNNLKADLPGGIRRIAAFLGISIDETTWPDILEHSGFDWMREAAGAAPRLMVHDIIEDGLERLCPQGHQRALEGHLVSRRDRTCRSPGGGKPATRLCPLAQDGRVAGRRFILKH